MTSVTCRVVPFVPGRRSTDEDAYPGLGSSDCAALVTGDTGGTGPDGTGPDGGNRAFVLFDVDGPEREVQVAVTVDGAPRPGWPRPVAVTGGGRQRLELRPNEDFAGLDLSVAAGLLRRVRVDVDGDHADLDVCDARTLGSLYQRIVERLVAPDAARQAALAGVPDPGPSYHPWYPVLLIGMDKAALYSAALVGDIVGKERHLSDPAWLLRVGVYLELLTCLGIIEAVKSEVGDLLEPHERAAFEASAVFAGIRTRIDSAAWKDVWALRRIAFAHRGLPRTGPVSPRNLLDKRRTTLRFLHVHHEDLKHAIELAGPNDHNAQETWHRVFRDAERAVLRQTAAAFPEIAFLPEAVRDVVLWQRRAFADQQGLYATACVQYRASMNAVAVWAKGRGLMDYTGDECIPVSVSLLHAQMHSPARVPLLQRADGYAGPLDVAEPQFEAEPTVEEIEALFGEVPILRMLSADDLRALASTARPVFLAPGERLVIQGQEGTSLFVVADGEVEVMLRRDVADVVVDRMHRGAVVGEMSLLTGEPRAATVRAGDGAVAYEIGSQQYAPLLQAHPEWLDELAAIMNDRLARRQVSLADLDAGSRSDLRARIRRRFFGD